MTYNFKIIRFLSSLKLTTASLFMLGVLVLLGTVDQVEHGLYLTQEKFFNSLFVFYGPVPLPSARTMMWVLFVNLLFTLTFKFNYSLKNTGLVITHFGLMTLLISGFLTFHFSTESFVNLKEGERSNIASDYMKWELLLVKDFNDSNHPASGQKKLILNENDLVKGKSQNDKNLGLTITVKEKYINAHLLETPFAGRVLKQLPVEKVYENNVRGLILDLILHNIDNGTLNTPGTNTEDTIHIELEGDKQSSYSFARNGFNYLLVLRKKQYKLPFTLELIDVNRELHPNTEKAKSFMSKIVVHEKDISRPLTISMNKPFRSGLYTAYQAGYGINSDGEEYTVLAVVKNINYWLPYFATIVTSLGLFIHFIQKFLKYAIRTRNTLIILTVFASIMLPTQAADSKPIPKPARQHQDGRLKNLNQFKKIIVMDQGRMKPLETYAQSLLLRFSGKSKINDSDAVSWLAETIFDPESARDKKVFLINNPEVLEALGVQPDKHRKYSFKDLEKGASKLLDYASKAMSKESADRSPMEREFVRVFTNVNSFVQLLYSMQIYFKHPDFTIRNNETQKYLMLESKTSSLLEIVERSGRLEKILEQINESEIKQLKTEPSGSLEKEIVSLSLAVFKWVESYRDLDRFFSENKSLAIAASIDNSDKQITWLNPWDLLLRPNANSKKELSLIKDIYDAYESKEQTKFDNAITIYRDYVRDKLGDNNIKAPRISIELFYNKLKPFTNVKFFYGFAFLLGMLGSITWSSKTLNLSNSLLNLIGMSSLALGFMIHALGILCRIFILERPPVTNLFETFVFVSWVIVLLGLVMNGLNAKTGSKSNLGLLLASFSGLVLLLISGKFAAEGDTMQVLIAVLDSNFWLSTHVICVTVGYAGVFAAGIVGHVYLIQRIWFKVFHKDLDTDSSLDTVLNTVLGILGFGLCFSFLGTMLGGIWADQSWGRFWGWDPKENGALLIVLWVAVLFHARMAGIIKKIGLAVGSVVACMVVITSWFGINLLGVGLHSYGFTDGIASTLLTYYGLETLFIVFSILLLIKRESR